MYGYLLLIPFFIIRFGLLTHFNKDAVIRAAHFPKMQGNEVIAYWIYQLSNVAVFIYLCLLPIQISDNLSFLSGITFYLIGLIMCAMCMKNFAQPASTGLNTNGLYKVSRNPMYVSYFVYFIGCVLLTQSWLLFGFIMVFQISAHWIILAEERWCIQQFGNIYKEYMSRVQRHIGFCNQ